MGHSGTLDPLATGCLLIATENSTKLLPLIENAKKEYIFTVNFNGRTDSLDAGTSICPVDMSHFHTKTEDELRNFISSQTEQIPPMYSALHVEWERAYDLARKWESFILPKRPIQVYEVEIIELTGLYVKIRMILSSGGYVRSFAPLIGDFFWVQGWYISYLRRTQIFTEHGTLCVETTSSLENPLPIDYAILFHAIPILEIEPWELEQIRLGKNLNLSSKNIQKWDSLIFLKNSNQNYISLCSIHNSIATIIRNDV